MEGFSAGGGGDTLRLEVFWSIPLAERRMHEAGDT